MRQRAILLALAVVLSTLPQLVWAQSRTDTPVLVLLADTGAIGASVDGLNVAKSLVGLASALNPDEQFAFTTVDRPEDILGPVSPTEPQFSIVTARIDSRLSTLPSPRSTNLFNALAEVYNFLAAGGATTGSAVYLLTGGLRDSVSETPIGRISPLLGRFQKRGWPVHGLALPDTSQPAFESLGGFAAISGGAVFRLSIYEGFEALSDHMLSSAAKGSLVKLTGGSLTPDRVLTASLDIAPGTGETTLVFYKEDPYGSFRLSNPSGFDSTAGDRTASYIVETPYVILWRLVDPAPGNWKVDVRGINGMISARYHSSNKYSIVLEPLSPIPLNESITLVAFVREDEAPVLLDGVRMYARLTTPDGASPLYEMRDDGANGDEAAGDGNFSVIVPPLKTPGEYQVDLELVWGDFKHRITSRAGFTGQHFPSVKVEPVGEDRLGLAQRTKVANIYVNVRGEPYPVSPDTISFGMSSGRKRDGQLEIVPRYVLGQDKTWLYDVYFTPSEEGLHRAVFWLRLEYGGRHYVHVSDSILLSSVSPPQIEPKTVEPPPPVVAVPEVAPPPPAPLAQEPSGFPTRAVALVVAVLAMIALAALYALTRPRPYGYLYTDRDELVVDFANMKRHPILRMLFGDRVGDKELNVPGLEGVSFRFGGGKVEVRTDQGAPSVRVNNHPLIGRATIRDRSWIGAHGKLYSFLLSPPEVQTGMGDD